MDGDFDMIEAEEAGIGESARRGASAHGQTGVQGAPLDAPVCRVAVALEDAPAHEARVEHIAILGIDLQVGGPRPIALRYCKFRPAASVIFRTVDPIARRGLGCSHRGLGRGSGHSARESHVDARISGRAAIKHDVVDRGPVEDILTRECPAIDQR